MDEAVNSFVFNFVETHNQKQDLKSKDVMLILEISELLRMSFNVPSSVQL